LDSAFEVGQILVDRGLQDGVCGVEVPMSEMVAHAGDLPPRAQWLRGQQIIRQCLDSLTDLQQADADRVEDQPSDRSPRCKWERIASIAAWISASRWRSR
jgi:hypothetical protein